MVVTDLLSHGVSTEPVQFLFGPPAPPPPNSPTGSSAPLTYIVRWINRFAGWPNLLTSTNQRQLTRSLGLASSSKL